MTYLTKLNDFLRLAKFYGQEYVQTQYNQYQQAHRKVCIGSTLHDIVNVVRASPPVAPK
jgi:hypothetical protein